MPEPGAAPESPLPDSVALRKRLRGVHAAIAKQCADDAEPDVGLDELDAYDAAVAQLRTRLRECEGERDAAYKLLRECEWAGMPLDRPDYKPGPDVSCRFCRATKGTRHYAHCALAALLAKAARADGGGT